MSHLLPAFPSLQQAANTTIKNVSSAAQWLVLSHLSSASCGILVLHHPSSADQTIGTASPNPSHAPANLTIHSSHFWLRVLLANDLGFAEAYLAGEISSPDLTAVFAFFIRNAASAHPASDGIAGRALSSLRTMLSSIFRRGSAALNDVAAAKRNAAAHYSLGNDLFAAFLSPDMTYSAPLWLPLSSSSSSEDTLEAAQRRKLHLAISAVRLKPGDRVLEIGSGWGSFALEAARAVPGCHITTVTPSAAQRDVVAARMVEAGLGDRIQVVVADYRELGPLADPVPFDKVVSIEMIENVGPEPLLAGYFACVDRYLKPNGGIGYFQSITIPEVRYAEYARGDDFIRRYIFPGGHLPTVSGLVDAIARGSGGKLVVEEVRSLGGHYGRALRCWRDKFVANFGEQIVPALRREYPGMTKEDVQVFRRTWEYYFCYCEAGFRAKVLGDVGVTVAREGCVQLLENVPQ